MSRVTVQPRAATMLKKLKALEGKVDNFSPILDELGGLLRKTTVSQVLLADQPDRPAVEAVEGGEAEAAPYPRPHRRPARFVPRCPGLRQGRDRHRYLVCAHPPAGRPDRRRIQAQERAGSTGIPKLPRLGSLTPGAGSPQRLAQAAFRKQTIRGRQQARQVRLPRRAFLGFDKRDRKRTTKLMIDRLSEALR